MRTIVVVRLEIKTSRRDLAFDAVDRVLDDGTLQDAIHDALEDARGLSVLSATCGGAEMVRSLAKELKT